MESKKNLKAVGERLRARREERRISRTDLAKKVGVSTTYLWMVEEARERANGAASQPSQFLLSQLAVELGMTREETYDLLELAGYQPVEDTPTNTDTIPISSLGSSGGIARQSGHATSQSTVRKRQRLAELLEEVRRGILDIDEGNELVISKFAAQVKPFLPECPLSEALRRSSPQSSVKVLQR
jgi:transcriptional regulator with XRE-family HTH domain